MRAILGWIGAGIIASAAGGLALEVVSAQSGPAEMTPAARAYLDHSIELFRQMHINASKMNWPELREEAYRAASGAKTTADTYPAIRLIIRKLGEKHTSLADPDQAKAWNTGQPSGRAAPVAFRPPEAQRLANGVGVIRLFDFMGSPPEAQTYAQAGEREVAVLKERGVCRFVVDLRSDQGGNMYPMITAVSGLLDDGVLGTFEDAAGHSSHWILKDGVVTTSVASDAQAPNPPRNRFPVAVLIGPSTASAGEFTAMSFKGRPVTSFFGAPSAGWITANIPVRLSDGAVILMTSGWGVDRTGKKYVDSIVPDQAAGPDQAGIAAAAGWLLRQPCPKTAGAHH